MTQDSFQRCYHLYFDSLRQYLYYRSGEAELATDLCQEVFLKLWQKQSPRPIEALKPLLYKMAKDLYVSHLRKQKVRQAHLQQARFELRFQEPCTDLQFQELKAQYEKALTRLSEKQRTVFLMNRWEGLTYQEIALRLGLSVKAIEKRMHTALSVLRQQLGQNEQATS